MSIEIVIARYNENLDWIKELPKNIKVTIYNKGINDIDYPFIPLENIGRESHTYLYHIIHNYNKLAEKTIFCQGGPIIHSPDFINLVNNSDLFEPVQPLSAYSWPEKTPPIEYGIPPMSIINKTKNLWINNKYQIHVNYVDNNMETKYPYYWYERHWMRQLEFLKKIHNVSNILQFCCTRFNIQNVDFNELNPIFYAGIFSVNKNVIHDNTVDFYKNILNILVNENTIYLGKVFDNGMLLEKLWLMIFNYKKNNKFFTSMKDYPLFIYNLNSNNNEIKFEFISKCSQLYFSLNINNIIYNIAISKEYIYLKNKYEKLIKIIPKLNKKIEGALKDALKDESKITINLGISKNRLYVFCNSVLCLEHQFKCAMLYNATVYNMADYNNFKIL